MPATRGVKRTASKSSASTASSSAPKNKKKRNVIQLEIPTAPKKRGRVLTCGQGDVGQLGLGEDVIETTKFKFVSALGDKVVDVCAGGMHTIALDSNGKVWTFGCNDEGALGRATSGESDEGTPKQVSLPLPCVSIAAGDSHSAALLNNGDVYAWGAFRDSHGSMGLVVQGREGKTCRDPVKVDVGETTADIASGGDHLVILTTSGSVLTMGCGEQGQLGRLSQRSAGRDTRQGFSALLVPSKVTLKCGASRIWAGYHATFVLDANNEKMFAWGLNNYGQLGITGEKRKTALYAPTECDAFNSASSWVAVACGQHHSLALDAAGQVYAIGRCEYGRLGLGERSGDAEALEPVPKLQSKKCVSIAAGTSNSFAVTDNGEVFAWGMGSEGQLGTGASSDAAEPCAAPLPPLCPSALVVRAGGQHSVLLAEDPSAPKAASPTPQQEDVDLPEEKSEEEQEEPEPEPEKKPKGRPTKRQKKQEQEEEISSTSSAQPSGEADDAKPPKVNGDEKKETPMEVDEIDNQTEKKVDTKAEDTKTEDTKTEDTKTEETKTEDTKSEDTKSEEQSDNTSETKEDKPETDTSSQDTVESDTKLTDTDIDMKEKPEVNVNGTPESQETVEAKTVPSVLQSEPLTTA